MLFVKIMSGEDLPDTDPYKNYVIVPVQNNEVMRFVDNSEFLVARSRESASKESGNSPTVARYLLEVHGPEGGCETHELSGNAYVMTESGKTIASHGA
jgi:hypothetical protein